MSAIEIGGFTYTHEQVEAAVNACWNLCMAYAVADPELGGGGYMDWDSVNQVHEEACKVFNADAIVELRAEAQGMNDAAGDPEEEVEESGFGFADTEGGSND